VPHDLVIRGGSVVDGTGREPVPADVAIDGERITAVGAAVDAGRREIDATGRLVTPGFVDIHTHLDAQIFWDPVLSSSCWHGVTTVVMGNCGVTFAPCRPEGRQDLAEMMESVEDIPADLIMSTLSWDWETYGQYLQAVRRLAKGVNVGGLVGHGALRYYVMGSRSLSADSPSRDELEQLQALVGEALDGGAMGVSTSRTLLHRVPDGRPIPGTLAGATELFAIADVLADRGTGVFELVARLGERDDAALTDSRAEMDCLADLSIASGRPVTFALIQTDARPDLHSMVLEKVDEGRSRGADLRPQAGARAIGRLWAISSRTPFDAEPTWAMLQTMPMDARVAALKHRPTRAQLVREAEDTFEKTPRYDPYKMFVLGSGEPRYDSPAEDALGAHAQRRHTSPGAAFVDLALEHDGDVTVFFPMLNQDLGAVEEMLSHEASILGLADAGAHVGQSIDAGQSTYFLTYWVRRRRRCTIGEGIRRLTQEPAQVFGLTDRGELRVGAVADLNVIDFDRLRLEPPSFVHDLPDGTGRYVQTADGYDHTIVAGDVFMDHGAHTGALPGRVLEPRGS
jgi:N-acyl-D-aspartate/D-glutamate deacylase